ncbi:MAG: hypothetical protein R6U26_01205 [Candidatus Undinarchaeales archaeon]
MENTREHKRYKFILERSSKEEFEEMNEKNREYIEFFMKETSVLANEESETGKGKELLRKEINYELKKKALELGMDKHIVIRHPTAGNIRFERFRVKIEEFYKFEKWEHEGYKPSFEDFTVPELRKIAEYEDVEVKTSYRKSKLIKTLKKKRVRKKDLLKIARRLKL